MVLSAHRALPEKESMFSDFVKRQKGAGGGRDDMLLALTG